MTGAIKLRVVDLSFSYGERQVLKSLSFELRKGQMLGFLGPNGAGKTTTFHLITGLLPFQQGSFYLDDKPADPQNPATREKWGVVFQVASLDQKLTARENLLLNAKLFCVPAKTARKRADELLALMELSERANDRVQTFSGGMKRRLEIARSLIHEPDLLILDEPTTGLDEAAYQKTWARLLGLRRETGITMLLTTHRADEADHCDDIIVLDEGKIIAQNSPDALKAQISADVLVLELHDSSQLQTVAGKLAGAWHLEGKIFDGKIHLLPEKAHEAIPKLVEAFPKNTFRSINIHRPTLSDVFMRLTGKSLAGEPAHV